MPNTLTSEEARLLVLEATVAALIGQLPATGLEEVAGMLAYLAEASEAAEAISAFTGTAPAGHVREWATKMLERVMVSRRASMRNFEGLSANGDHC